MIEKAKNFAFKKHNEPTGCQRYGSSPYSFHLECVVFVAERYKYLLKNEDIEDAICAAYLHDIIEDTDVTPMFLKKKFNDRIADVVYRVTNEIGFDRKEKNFRTYPKIWPNDLAVFVKLSDRIANTKNSKETEHSMYGKYTLEYPVFRYAIKVRGLYEDMWKELDELNNYKK